MLYLPPVDHLLKPVSMGAIEVSMHLTVLNKYLFLYFLLY
jgi:hypothetical protein